MKGKARSYCIFQVSDRAFSQHVPTTVRNFMERKNDEGAEMKMVKLIIAMSAVLFLFFGEATIAQNKDVRGKQLDVYASSIHGFKFQYEGTLTERDKDEYVIKLPANASGDGAESFVHIFVDARPFVYLPGTYGGKYYYSEAKDSRVTENRIPDDSVSVNGVRFARDYWAVYAGQGQWETVINCYAFHEGQYYVVSCVHNFLTAMPGETVNGVRTSKQQIRTKLINALHDTTNDYVKSFNQILGSVSFTK